MVNKFIKLTLLLVSICVLLAAPVFGDSAPLPPTTFTFTFTPPTTTLGLLNPTETFTQDFPTQGSESFTASGFSNGADLCTLANSTCHGLFGRPEGLGLHGTDRSDITGSRFIQLDITALVASGATALSVSVFRSSSGNATWNLWGSDVFGVKGRQLGPSATINHPATFSLLEVPNFRNFDFISVGSGGGGVLLADLEVTAPTPPAPIPATEPSSAGLLLIGLGALVAAGILGKKLLA